MLELNRQNRSLSRYGYQSFCINNCQLSAHYANVRDIVAGNRTNISFIFSSQTCLN